jgi:hypothetical protein
MIGAEVAVRPPVPSPALSPAAADFGPDRRVQEGQAVWNYGLALLLGHVLCLIYLRTAGAVHLLIDATDPICWPFLEACHRLRFRSMAPVALTGGAYLGIVVFGAAAWFGGRQRLFQVSFAIATGLLAAILSLDYRLRQNQYYMFLWVCVVYLAVPRHAKPACLKLLIVLFYFWAGFLKLNREWLSGAVLYRELWLVPPSLVPIACGYVVVLELVLIWGMFSRSIRLFWLTLAQLALFHVMSLSQINWFYPAIMGTILSLFVLMERTGPARANWRWGDLGTRERWAVAAVALLFSGCQMAPRLYPGDTTLTGQGRWFALHMFEARQECQVKVLYRHRDGRREETSILRAGYPPRLVCDPIIYYGVARNLCRRLPQGVSDLDLVMDAKRRTDPAFKRIIDAPMFCTRVDDWRVLGGNEWIVADAGPH